MSRTPEGAAPRLIAAEEAAVALDDVLRAVSRNSEECNQPKEDQ